MDFLTSVVNTAFSVFKMLVFARIVISWIRLDPYNPIVRFIYEMTEPIMGPLRRIIPPIGMIDISPIVLFLLLNFLQTTIVRMLINM